MNAVDHSSKGTPPCSFEEADIRRRSPCRHDAVCPELLMEQIAREKSNTVHESNSRAGNPRKMSGMFEGREKTL